MLGLRCNACNKEFTDVNSQKTHYKSEWHRYNIKRKIAGVPGVTEALFLARQSALAKENSKLHETPMLYTCGLCGKGYRSSNAHAQHLKSRAHTAWASQADHQSESTAIIKPLPPRMANKLPQHDDEENDEWEEVDQDVDLLYSNHNEMDGSSSDVDMDEGEEELDPTCCFMCDQEHKTIESCMIHMHKSHGFFIPDVKYLKDPYGIFTYLGLKVKRDYMCLYCSSSCQPFNSLEAVRKHMEAKSHCRVHYGDGDEGEAELDEFYDYSSSYVDGNGTQLATLDVGGDRIELGSGGSELIITRSTDDGISTKAIGSRGYIRYYRQQPRPSLNSIATTAVLAARYRSMGLSTVQSKENMVRTKVMKQMNRTGVEAMRSKIGMNSNVIRNLPKNVTH
ncbi:putative transcription factor C2H2 family [Helianthus annuus]|nr:putative transcription factor C2H2 family [Helianthus annuus]